MAAGGNSAAARSRYADAFSSSIFGEVPERLGQGFVPAGKRRDMTTSEIFGDHNEKDLRGAAKTFVPKEDYLDARQKKLNSLSSGALPGHAPHGAQGMWSGADGEGNGFARGPQDEEGLHTPRMQGSMGGCMGMGEEEEVDTRMVRQMDLSSKLFGRQTPGVLVDQLHDKSQRLTPNDVTWDNHPEVMGHGAPRAPCSAAQRAYTERCSGLFGHSSPDVDVRQQESDRRAREEERAGEKHRAADAHFSDLFGRVAHASSEAGDGSAAFGRPRTRRSAEDAIGGYQDWTDSRTELLGARSSPNRPYSAAARKNQEMHGSNAAALFGGGTSDAWSDIGGSARSSELERPAKLTFDNSRKVKEAFGSTPQQIHQAHLRSSIRPDTYYEEVETAKEWEVAELHVAGLPRNADERMVREICQGADHGRMHVSRVTMDMDPVRNQCKGRARLMIRYNPEKESTEALVRQLEAANLRVEQ